MSNNPTETFSPNITFGDTASTGSLYVPVHGDRRVNIYPIQEHELKTISICNTQMSLWCSIGTGFLFLIASGIWDMCTSEADQAKGSIPLLVLFGVIVVSSYVIAGYHWWIKGSEIDAIRKETLTKDGD